jgi:hypothetical protein
LLLGKLRERTLYGIAYNIRQYSTLTIMAMYYLSHSRFIVDIVLVLTRQYNNGDLIFGFHRVCQKCVDAKIGHHPCT